MPAKTASCRLAAFGCRNHRPIGVLFLRRSTMRAARPEPSSAERAGFGHLEAAEKTVLLAVDPGCEIHAIGIAAIAAIAVDQRPEAIEYDRVSCGIGELAEEEVGHRVVGIDRAVAEIPDKKVTGETAEPRRRDIESPRRIEETGRRDPCNEISVEIEDADKAVAWAGDIVFL